MDGDRGGDVNVGLGDRRVVYGEIGPGIVGDEDGLAGKQSREARLGLEELEIGEGEPLRHYVVREQERVSDADGVVLGHKDGGAQGK